jgi:hypothetical protein
MKRIILSLFVSLVVIFPATSCNAEKLENVNTGQTYVFTGKINVRLSDSGSMAVMLDENNTNYDILIQNKQYFTKEYLSVSLLQCAGDLSNPYQGQIEITTRIYLIDPPNKLILNTREAQCRRLP